jgi:hypothetical protein
MLPESFIQAAVVLGMFVVRIGVPIALTLALGYWLEKKLHPREEQQEQAPQIKLVSRPAKSGKIIQLHCWDVRRCETTQRSRSELDAQLIKTKIRSCDLSISKPSGENEGGFQCLSPDANFLKYVARALPCWDWAPGSHRPCSRKIGAPCRPLPKPLKAS